MRAPSLPDSGSILLGRLPHASDSDEYLFRSSFADLLAAFFGRVDLGLTMGKVEVQRPDAWFGVAVGLGRRELP